MYLMYPLLAQVYFFVNVLLTTNFLWVLLSLGTHIFSKFIPVFTYCYIESVPTGVCLYLLQIFFAFLCDITFSEVCKRKWKSCIFDYENTNKLKRVYPQN